MCSYFKQKKMSFFLQVREQEGRTGPVLEVGTSGRMLGKCVRGWLWWKYRVYMYVNGKMRPVGTIPGTGGWGRITENVGWGEFSNDILLELL
jgi:hypothetical protein